MYLVPEKSFRDIALSQKGPGRDAGHFVPFRDSPGQSGTLGQPTLQVEISMADDGDSLENESKFR